MGSKLCEYNLPEKAPTIRFSLRSRVSDLAYRENMGGKHHSSDSDDSSDCSSISSASSASSSSDSDVGYRRKDRRRGGCGSSSCCGSGRGRGRRDHCCLGAGFILFLLLLLAIFLFGVNGGRKNICTAPLIVDGQTIPRRCFLVSGNVIQTRPESDPLTDADVADFSTETDDNGFVKIHPADAPSKCVKNLGDATLTSKSCDGVKEQFRIVGTSNTNYDIIMSVDTSPSDKDNKCWAASSDSMLTTAMSFLTGGRGAASVQNCYLSDGTVNPMVLVSIESDLF